MKPMEPRERYIAIGGECWAAALGTERSKWITPKVGIFLYGADNRPTRDQVEGMAFMSANSEMALHPLLQIMEVMHAIFLEHSEVSQEYQHVANQFQIAINAVRATDRLVNKQP